MPGFSTNIDNTIPGVAYNDLYTDAGGNLAINSDDDEIQETCCHAVLLTLCDYVFNTNIGVPYDQYLSSDNPIGNKLKLSIVQALKSVKGVVNIAAFNADLDRVTRKLQLNILVNLISGNTVPVNVTV